MRATLLAVAALAVGCDSVGYPEATNPYDPDFAGDRVVSAPAALHLTESDATSITVAWDDPSSFEAGFRLEVASVPAGPNQLEHPVVAITAVLPPNTTSHTVRGLTGVGDLEVRVVALGAGRSESAPSPALRLRYPGRAERLLTYYQHGEAVVSYSGETAFVGDYDDLGRAVAFSVGGAAPLAEAPRIDRYAGRFGSDGAVAYGLNSLEDDGARPFAVFEGGAVRTGLLEDPGLGLHYALIEEGTVAVSADGRTLAAAWGGAPGERATLRTWDLGTGRLRPDSPAALEGDPYLLGVTPGGLVVYVDGRAETDRTVRAVDLKTGALAWTRMAPQPVAGRPALDAPGGQILFPDGAAYVVADAETGREVRRLAPALDPTFVGSKLVLQGRRAVACGLLAPSATTGFGVEVCYVLDAETGAVLRAVPIGATSDRFSNVPFAPEAPNVGASDAAFVFVHHSLLVRVPLFERWEVVAPAP